MWVADLADMQLINKFNKEFQILLCVVNIYIKCTWIVPLKDKKGIAITNTFQNILDKSNRKPNETWVEEGSKFYNRSMQIWLQDNDIEMYSTRHERKYVVTKALIRTLKYKI